MLGFGFQGGKSPHLPHYIKALDKVFYRSKPILFLLKLYHKWYSMVFIYLSLLRLSIGNLLPPPTYSGASLRNTYPVSITSSATDQLFFGLILTTLHILISGNYITIALIQLQNYSKVYECIRIRSDYRCMSQDNVLSYRHPPPVLTQLHLPAKNRFDLLCPSQTCVRHILQYVVYM